MTGTLMPAVAKRSAKFDAALMLDRDAGDRPQGALERGPDGRSVGVSCRSLRAPFSDETEAPLAALIARNGVEEVLLAKVRPEDICEVELRVGQAIEEEVRDAPFASRADDEVGVADGEARHVGPQRLGRDVFGANPAGGHGFGELAGRVGNLLPASVREGEGQGHLVVLLALLPEGVEHRTNERRQAA